MNKFGLNNQELQQSSYHFDINKPEQEGDYFQILGRFSGSDWSEETTDIIESTNLEKWTNLSRIENKKSPVHTFKNYELEEKYQYGKVDICSMKYDLSKYPIINKMIDYLSVLPDKKIQKSRVAHIQRTGQMFHYHIDTLTDRSPEDPEKICRITIMLQDWIPGQFFMYGNCMYTHWQAGEVHVFDWLNTPHATANASNFPRPSIQVTGFKSDRTRELIANTHKDNIFKV
jgi:hypothetical protein